MKKALLIIVVTILSLCSASLYSAEPVDKFYLQDGSSKQYNLSDIENMKFSSAPDTLQLQIFTNDSKTFYYPVQLIDIVKFAKDSILNQHIQLWHDGFKWDFALHTIDSILIYYTKFVAVTIGRQHWMYRNLNVNHLRNGDSIPEVRDSPDVGACCYYNNDPAMGAIYGRLYDWYSAASSGLPPIGWHLPSDDEWLELTIELGYEGGCKMKEAGLSHWFKPNTGATNETGFTALPGGSDYFNDLGKSANWWSRTTIHSKVAWDRSLNYQSEDVYRNVSDFNRRFSVRCIKD